jgi:uncharacterized protein YabN with tetrapyrrole methylase and pyrophosphatase domain
LLRKCKDVRKVKNNNGECPWDLAQEHDDLSAYIPELYSRVIEDDHASKKGYRFEM